MKNTSVFTVNKTLNMDLLQQRKTRMQNKLMSLQDSIRLQVRSEKLKQHPNKDIFAKYMFDNYKFETSHENLKIPKKNNESVELKNECEIPENENVANALEDKIEKYRQNAKELVEKQQLNDDYVTNDVFKANLVTQDVYAFTDDSDIEDDTDFCDKKFTLNQFQITNNSSKLSNQQNRSQDDNSSIETIESANDTSAAKENTKVESLMSDKIEHESISPTVISHINVNELLNKFRKQKLKEVNDALFVISNNAKSNNETIIINHKTLNISSNEKNQSPKIISKPSFVISKTEFENKVSKTKSNKKMMTDYKKSNISSHQSNQSSSIILKTPSPLNSESIATPAKVIYEPTINKVYNLSSSEDSQSPSEKYDIQTETGTKNEKQQNLKEKLKNILSQTYKSKHISHIEEKTKELLKKPHVCGVPLEIIKMDENIKNLQIKQKTVLKKLQLSDIEMSSNIETSEEFESMNTLPSIDHLLPKIHSFLDYIESEESSIESSIEFYPQEKLVHNKTNKIIAEETMIAAAKIIAEEKVIAEEKIITEEKIQINKLRKEDFVPKKTNASAKHKKTITKNKKKLIKNYGSPKKLCVLWYESLGPEEKSANIRNKKSFYLKNISQKMTKIKKNYPTFKTKLNFKKLTVTRSKKKIIPKTTINLTKNMQLQILANQTSQAISVQMRKQLSILHSKKRTMH